MKPPPKSYTPQKIYTPEKMPSRKETSLPTLIQALFFRGHMKLRGYDSSRYPPGASCAWFGLGQSNTPMDSLMKGPGMLWGEYHSNDE